MVNMSSFCAQKIKNARIRKYRISHHPIFLSLHSSRKYPYSHHRSFFAFHPLSPPPPFPQEILIYYHILLASKIKTLPLGISNDLPSGGYGFFLELHIVDEKLSNLFCIVDEKLSNLFCIYLGFLTPVGA